MPVCKHALLLVRCKMPLAMLWCWAPAAGVWLFLLVTWIMSPGGDPLSTMSTAELQKIVAGSGKDVKTCLAALLGMIIGAGALVQVPCNTRPYPVNTRV